MSPLLKFMFRKIVYVAVGTGLAAGAAYVNGKPNLSDWTLHGAMIAVGTAIGGAVLSGVLGGSLADKTPQ